MKNASTSKVEKHKIQSRASGSHSRWFLSQIKRARRLFSSSSRKFTQANPTPRCEFSLFWNQQYFICGNVLFTAVRFGGVMCFAAARLGGSELATCASLSTWSSRTWSGVCYTVELSHVTLWVGRLLVCGSGGGWCGGKWSSGKNSTGCHRRFWRIY